jgi:hypothetical protein
MSLLGWITGADARRLEDKIDAIAKAVAGIVGRLDERDRRGDR